MAPKNKLTSPRKLEKALTEVARASGVPEERTAEALAAFAKIMVEKFGWNTPEKIASGSLGDAALLDAARDKDPEGDLATEWQGLRAQATAGLLRDEKKKNGP